MTIDQTLLDKFVPGSLLKVSQACVGFQYKPDPWNPTGLRNRFSLELNDLVTLCKLPFPHPHYRTYVYPVLHPIHGRIILNFNLIDAMNFLEVVSVEEDE